MAFDLAGQALQCHRRLQVSNHGVHFGGLQDGLELGVAAGPTDFIEPQKGNACPSKSKKPPDWAGSRASRTSSRRRADTSGLNTIGARLR